MSKSIMTDTRTINFLELFGNGKQYTIPAFQRDYSWVENPSELWIAAIPEQDWPKQVYRLGNLTLLEGSLNREIGNKLFPEKVIQYGKSRYRLTTNIVSDPPEEWTVAQIEQRQWILASRAVHLWRSDFA